MRLSLTYLAAASLVIFAGDSIAQQNIGSVYTDISDEACVKHIDDESTGAFTMTCPGIHGFRLQVLNDDERSSISIVTPDNLVFPLNYWDVVTRGFSTLGTRVEWRVGYAGGKAIPVAVIVRVNAIDQSDPEHPKRLPLLAVAKISGDAACVTRAVNALTPDANKQARRFADNRHVKCLSSESEPKR